MEPFCEGLKRKRILVYIIVDLLNREYNKEQIIDIVGWLFWVCVYVKLKLTKKWVFKKKIHLKKKKKYKKFNLKKKKNGRIVRK